MATPKQKISKSKRNMRRAHLGLNNKNLHVCTGCYSTLKLLNTVCDSCGMLNNKNIASNNYKINSLNLRVRKDL